MRLPFELDPQIIHHIIYSQAGSIGKAIIELLMNSVDASAKAVTLTMTKDGFECADDGNGFASREDVLLYFGRFGTPHAEGDATYGRFRLGRGQIMAHATTVWESRSWQMTVDTRSMGYAYDLEEINNGHAGCKIKGSWYEALNDTELMSALQEVRDLVRYTPVSVELNGQSITRHPAKEKWDYEDDCAYYRVKAEGGVSIYNQGVLVRHDSSHVWGAGGLIVSKKAVALNVSRTEILRKTCPVWKVIAKQFGSMASEFAEALASNRKTEAWREKVANDMLAGVGDLYKAFHYAEIVTVLPGKRHITMSSLQRKGRWKGNYSMTVVENDRDIPKGEQIAKSLGLPVIHPVTLQRFGCHTPEDFLDVVTRIHAKFEDQWARSIPALIDFHTVKAAFVERTVAVPDADLDKETRRAWTALKWCLQNYAGACLGRRVYRSGACEGPIMEMILGESNVAQAWTDGKTYVAFNADVIRGLRARPFETVSYVFGLLEHELAHEGDSMSCGHDEAFYQRFHDISIKMGLDRQRYIHKWMMKYAQSMAKEGKRKGEGSRVWYEMRLREAIGSGRQKRGLKTDADPLSSEEQEEALLFTSTEFLVDVNDALIEAGVHPPPTDWTAVDRWAQQERLRIAQERREKAARESEEAEEHRLWQAAAEQEEQDYWAQCQQLLQLFSEVVGVPVGELDFYCQQYVMHRIQIDESQDRNQLVETMKSVWATKPWLDEYEDMEASFEDHKETIREPVVGMARTAPLDFDDELAFLTVELRSKVQPEETLWSLQRNAAAAGFGIGSRGVESYLEWRAFTG